MRDLKIEGVLKSSNTNNIKVVNGTLHHELRTISDLIQEIKNVDLKRE